MTTGPSPINGSRWRRWNPALIVAPRSLSTHRVRRWLGPLGVAALTSLSLLAVPEPALRAAEGDGDGDGDEESSQDPALTQLLNDGWTLAESVVDVDAQETVLDYLGNIEDYLAEGMPAGALEQSLALQELATTQTGVLFEQDIAAQIAANAKGIGTRIELGMGSGAAGPLGWKLTFWDDFSGPGSSGRDGVLYDADCYDSSATPPMCGWFNGKAGLCNNNPTRNSTLGNQLDLTNLAPLNKCVWQVLDKWNPWTTGAPISAHHPQHVTFEPLLPGSSNLVMVLDAKHDQAWVDGSEPVCDGDDEKVYPPWQGWYEISAKSPNCPVRVGAVISKHHDPSPLEGDVGIEGFTQTYGRFEFRALLPTEPGAFPAAWMLAQNEPVSEGAPGEPNPYYREIDVFELVGGRPDWAHGSFHTRIAYPPSITVPDVDSLLPTPLSQSKGHGHATGDMRYGEEWHVFAVEWEPSRLRYFIDDLEIGRVDEGDLLEARRNGTNSNNDPLRIPAPANIPTVAEYMLMDMSILSSGGLDVITFSNWLDQFYKIDYVRVYERCVPGQQQSCVSDEDPRSRIATDLYGMNGIHRYNPVDQEVGPTLWGADRRKLLKGDFDGDDADDILLQNIDASGHSTYLLQADGHGDFAYRRVMDTIPWMNRALWSDAQRRAQVGDFNGDNADDILLRNRSASGHSSYLLLADGTGGFHSSEVVDTEYGMLRALWADEHRDVHMGYFNDDDCPDLLLRNRATSGHASYLLAATCSSISTDPVFDYREVITSAYGMLDVLWADDLRKAHVGDFNDDGCDDLLLQNRPTSGHASYLLMATCSGDPGDPMFGDRTVVTDLYGLNGALWADDLRKLHVGDFDGDGCDDLLLQNRPDAGHASYRVMATCTVDPNDAVFDYRTVVTTANGMTNAAWADDRRQLHVGDINGDDADDLLLVGRDGNESSLYLQADGSGGFDAAETVDEAHNMARHLWTADHHRAVLGDWDGDLRQDVVLQGDGGQNTDLWRVVNGVQTLCNATQDPTVEANRHTACPFYDTYVMYLDR